MQHCQSPIKGRLGLYLQVYDQGYKLYYSYEWPVSFNTNDNDESLLRGKGLAMWVLFEHIPTGPNNQTIRRKHMHMFTGARAQPLEISKL